MAHILSDGELATSTVVLQKFSSAPPLKLSHSVLDEGRILVHLEGIAIVEARSLVSAILALVPSASPLCVDTSHIGRRGPL